MVSLAYWVFPAVLIAAVLAVAADAGLTIAFGWEVNVGESINSYFADHFVQTGGLYRDWGPLTPYFPVYPPGFYWVVSPFQLFDHAAIWQGRVLSALAFTGAGLSAWAIARRLGCQIPEALTSALAFPLVSVTALLVATARPDGVALGMIAVTLWLATRWEDERRRSDLLIAAALTAAFVVVKYNFAPIGLGIAVAIFLRDRRAAITYCAIAAGLTVFAFVLAQVISSGQFSANTRDFGTGYSLDSLTYVLRSLPDFAPNFLLVAGGAEVLGAFLLRQRPRAIHLAWIGSVVVILSAIKVGSSLNYLAPAAVLSSILIGPGLMRLRTRINPLVALAASIALAIVILPSTVDRVCDVPGVHDAFSVASAANEQARTRLAAAPGPVFGDRNDLTIEAGKGPSFDNLPMTILAGDGTWDTGPLVELIEGGKIGMVESGFDLSGPIPGADSDPVWPPEVVRAVRENYCLSWQATVTASTGPGIWLYEPATGRSCPEASASAPAGP